MISIIAVLAALLLPALSSAKDRGRRIVCLSQARQIAIGGITYAGDFGGVLPGTALDNNGWWCDRYAFSNRANQTLAMTGAMILVTQNYAANDLKFLICPSRTDHPFSDPGYSNNMYLKNKYWQMGFSCYIWDASAGFTQISSGKWSTGVFWARIEQLDPRQLLLADVIAYEPNVNWREYRSTNHLVRGNLNEPAGGNYVRLDGSGCWLPYARTNWNSFGNNEECRPAGNPIDAAYNDSNTFRNSPLFWRNPSSTPSGPIRGKAFFYDDG